MIKPHAKPTLFLNATVNHRLREKWQRRKKFRDFLKQAQDGVGSVSGGKEKKFKYHGTDLYPPGDNLPVDVTDEDFDVPDEEMDETEIKELMHRSGIRSGGGGRGGTESKEERKRHLAEKIGMNRHKLAWMHNRIDELEEICLKQKLMIAKYYAVVGTINMHS